jgi:hypothetical protein
MIDRGLMTLVMESRRKALREANLAVYTPEEKWPKVR